MASCSHLLSTACYLRPLTLTHLTPVMLGGSAGGHIVDISERRGGRWCYGFSDDWYGGAFGGSGRSRWDKSGVGICVFGEGDVVAVARTEMNTTSRSANICTIATTHTQLCPWQVTGPSPRQARYEVVAGGRCVSDVVTVRWWFSPWARGVPRPWCFSRVSRTVRWTCACCTRPCRPKASSGSHRSAST